MSTGKYDDECYDVFGMNETDFLNCGMNHDDPVIKEFAAGTIYQIKGGHGCYLLVDCNALPGIRIAGVWPDVDAVDRFLEEHRS